MLQLRKNKDSPYWQIRGSIKVPNGSHRIRQSSGTTDRQEAENYALEIHRRVIDNSYGKGHSTNYSFGSATISYLTAKKSIDPSTSARIRFLNQYFGNTCLTDINNGMFNTILNRTKPGIEPSYFNRIKNQLNAIRKHGAKQVGDGETLILPKIYGRKVEKPKPVFLTYEEQEILINEFNPILRPLIIFLCYTGARIGEAVCLRWEDINMDKRTISFWKTKNGDFRTIPMHIRVYESLRMLNRPREGAIFFSTLNKPFKYFYTRSGDVMDQTHRKAVKRAFNGTRKFKVHNWRSHWASTHALAGINDRKLMALGGWNDAKSVTHYIKLNPEHLRIDINKMK